MSRYTEATLTGTSYTVWAVDYNEDETDSGRPMRYTADWSHTDTITDIGMAFAKAGWLHRDGYAFVTCDNIGRLVSFSATLADDEHLLLTLASYEQMNEARTEAARAIARDKAATAPKRIKP